MMRDDDEWAEYDPFLDDAKQRIRPVHKPYKASQCEWVPSFGWIYNPTGREYK